MINFEGLPSQINEENEAEFLPVRNGMQLELMQRYAKAKGIDNPKEIADEWIEQYSAKFREVFRDLYNEDPDLFAEYKKNKEKILDIIEAKIKDLIEV